MTDSEQSARPRPWIYINGTPCAGKQTIATALVALLPPPARLLPNHALIDLPAALFPRSSPAYQPFRYAMRRITFDALAGDAEATRSQTWVFTDCRMTLESPAPLQYRAAARAIDPETPFISIHIECEQDEIERRLRSDERIVTAAGTTKLVGEEGVEVWRTISTDIYTFPPEEAITGHLVVDSTHRSARECADQIYDYLVSLDVL